MLKSLVVHLHKQDTTYWEIFAFNFKFEPHFQGSQILHRVSQRHKMKRGICYVTVRNIILNFERPFFSNNLGSESNIYITSSSHASKIEVDLNSL